MTLRLLIMSFVGVVAFNAVLVAAMVELYAVEKTQGLCAWKWAIGFGLMAIYGAVWTAEFKSWSTNVKVEISDRTGRHVRIAGAYSVMVSWFSALAQVCAVMELVSWLGSGFDYTIPLTVYASFCLSMNCMFALSWVRMRLEHNRDLASQTPPWYALVKQPQSPPESPSLLPSQPRKKTSQTQTPDPERIRFSVI
jgi:hypothetical protein